MGHGGSQLYRMSSVPCGEPPRPVEGLAPYNNSHMGPGIQKGSKISHLTLPFSFSLGCKVCFKVMMTKGKHEINVASVRSLFLLTYIV